MRAPFLRAATVCALLVLFPSAAAAQSRAARSLVRNLRGEMALAGRSTGALVIDLNTGRRLYASRANVPRMPASVEKLYTTSTALLRFGPSARFTTSVLGAGSVAPGGAWQGTLYLKGGGDPTFGSESFDRATYDGGATVQRLVANLIAATGIRSVQGAVVGDESLFDSRRGTPPYNYAPSFEVEGQLSALAYDRGFATADWSSFQSHPAVFATQQFVAALKAAGVHVAKGTSVSTGVTPPGTPALATVDSPAVSWLIHLTNTPSDNFLAETLLKDLGASFGGAGTTAAGAAVVRSEIETAFGLQPVLVDGSGLSREDHTSPAQVVTLLRDMRSNISFMNSLAIAGRTGTMRPGLRGTAAQGRCRGKTGTLRDVASLVGLCSARDGHTLAFAILMNYVDPVAGHALEDKMAAAVSRYNG